MIHPYIHIPFNRIEEYLFFIKEKKFNLEILFTSQILDSIKESEIIELKDKLDFSTSVTIHAPYMDLSPGAVDSKVRIVTLERFFHILEIAKILKPKSIVFHSGYEKWKYALNVNLWLEMSLKTWQLILREALSVGTKIAIENIFEDNPINLRLLMEEMGSESFGICFDSGHFNLFSRVSLKEWLNQLRPYIIELHLHDNKGTFDDHFAIGEGSFDFNTLFSEMRGKDIIYTIEAHTPDGVIKSINRLKDILDSSNFI